MGTWETWNFYCQVGVSICFLGSSYSGNSASTSTSSTGERSCWKIIWKCEVPPTVRNFAWRLAMDALPTWKNKNKIGLEPVSGCLVCGMEVEDNFHPFLRCQLGRDLYKAMAKVWKLPAIESFMPTGKEWLLHALDPLCEVDRSKVLLIFWRSRYVRNELVPQKLAPVMEVSVSFLRRYLDELLGIKLNSEVDPVKGNGFLSFDHLLGTAASPQ